jgi:hypothetical protein
VTRVVFDGLAARAVYAPGSEAFLRSLGGRARRASHVELIEEGPNAGLHFADLSLLGERHQLCLWPPSVDRREALAKEVEYVNQWLLNPT